MKNKLHILFICGWYPSKVLPTNGDFIQRHAEAVSLKHEVSVLHIISDKNTHQNINIESNKINKVDTHIAYIKETNNSIIKFLRFWKAYFLLMKKIKPFDILHLNEIYPFGIFALHQKWIKKKPYIISEHWTGYHSPFNKSISTIEILVSKFIVKNANFVCPVSDNLKESMLSIGLKGNYFKIPNVVDTTIFKPTEELVEKFTIVHISSMLDTHKNITGMLDVAKKLEDSIGKFTWYFIGGEDKTYKGKLEKLNFTKANIEFIKHIPQKDLIQYLQQATVFVLFSNYENLPCVILESFCCGTPVISTDVGGIKEYFPNNFGKLIEKNNKKQLLESILEYQNKKIPKEEMHEYAKSNFSRMAIAENFSKLYYKTLKHKN
ncbi:glycosyltransferase involved in cell wall biosynthesis [Lutibacter sp. Hel_I_33_5]|uniref:glycosyltransferase family 4 protein n=1 Tax=Lutibacter sp. Hel_I_33_5 TaxID=1566289 RepID=UPI0011A2D9DC|nr:glycosyltransferase family 4 protein [Lutibacter sp. Hel_I_33_5]TVZ56966.1 glycosyltransferase involved in cell wall biosynthesis [Lutibacter sp. Hel_I_33_5]